MTKRNGKMGYKKLPYKEANLMIMVKHNMKKCATKRAAGVFHFVPNGSEFPSLCFIQRSRNMLTHRIPTLPYHGANTGNRRYVAILYQLQG